MPSLLCSCTRHSDLFSLCQSVAACNDCPLTQQPCQPSGMMLCSQAIYALRMQSLSVQHTNTTLVVCMPACCCLHVLSQWHERFKYCLLLSNLCMVSPVAGIWVTLMLLCSLSMDYDCQWTMGSCPIRRNQNIYKLHCSCTKPSCR